MPDPTGRWVNERQWQCPRCGTVNSYLDERCRHCALSVRPSEEEPIRPPDVLDLIGPDRSAEGEQGDRPETIRRDHDDGSVGRDPE